MNILERGCNSITLVSLDTKFLEQRRIFIDDEITKQTANEFCKKLMYLNSLSTREPIHVFINSPGGEVVQGMLMYDAIQGSRAPVRLYCTGEACSMAAILLSGGRHGRYILPHSKVMIHEPLIRGGIGGKSSSIKSISDSMLETRRMLNEILAKHTRHTLAEIDEATAYDHYFTAPEAVEFGLCDKVVSLDEMTEEV